MTSVASPVDEAGLKLELVQVLFRHGERMPMKPAALFAPYTQTAPWSSLRTPYTDSKRTSSEPTQDTTSGSSSISGINIDDHYIPNELTALGHLTTQAIGQRLRQRYINDLHFLPARLHDNDQIHMRSSILSRSYKSLESVFNGLYPSGSRDPGHETAVIETREPEHENLYPNRTYGPRLRELTDHYQQRAAQKWNDSPQVAKLNQSLAPSLSRQHSGMAVDSVPSVEQLRDYIVSKLATKPCHEDIPYCFQDHNISRIMEDICIDFRLSGFSESAEIRALGIGTLLDELIWRMKSIREMISHEQEITAPRFIILSSHDTTLAAILICLEAAREIRWPVFSTTLVFELFSRQEEPIQYYVRIFWNEEIIRIPHLDQDQASIRNQAGIYSLNSFVRLVEERTSLRSGA